MGIDEFLRNFELAVQSTLDLTRAMVHEPLNGPYLFYLFDRENSFVASLTLKEAAERIFFKEGRVPSWINLVVVGEDDTGTWFRCDFSDRWTREVPEMSSADTASPPFHVLAPALPPRLRDKVKSILEQKSSSDWIEWMNENRFTLTESPGFATRNDLERG